MKTTKTTMKSLTQQIVTGLSLALVVMAIAVCAPNQALANGKGQKSASAKVQPPQRNGVGRSVMRPTENFSLNSKAVKSSQSGGEQTRPGSTTQGKYGPKKPLGVWVWVECDKSYVWM